MQNQYLIEYDGTLFIMHSKYAFNSPLFVKDFVDQSNRSARSSDECLTTDDIDLHRMVFILEFSGQVNRYNENLFG